MSDLERALRELRIDWPETPDIAGAVAARLEPRTGTAHPSRPGRRPWLRRAALALVLLIGGVAAVPDARSAVLEFLGLESVKIERREPAPTRSFGQELDLGRAVTLAEARRRSGMSLAPPSVLGTPDGVFHGELPFDGGRVSFVYGSAGRPDVLVQLMRAQVTPFIEKTAGAGTDVERLEVDGAPAFFLSGEPHGVVIGRRDGNDVIVEDQRLAGSTLLVERDDVLIRIEGAISRERAVAIARSIGGRAG